MIAGMPPTDAGFAAAITDARRRRWNSLAASAAAAAVFALVATVAPSFRSTAGQNLDVTNPAPGEAPGWYVPDEPPVVADPLLLPLPPAGNTTVATGATRGRAVSPAVSPSPSPALRRNRMDVVPSGGMTGFPCGLTGSGPWYCGGATWTGGTTRKMTLRLCDRPEPQQARLSHPLTYQTRLETDFLIEGPDGFRWQWSTSQHFPRDVHTRTLSNNCLTWSTVWDLIGNDGRETPNGAYRLTATSSANELRGVRWMVDFNVNYQH